MWLRDPMDIEVSRNASVPLGFQLLDEQTSEYIDLSGASIECHVAAVDGDSNIVTFDAQNIDTDTAEFDIVFDGNALSVFSDNAQETVILSYEIVVAQSGESVIAMRGKLYLSPGIN